MRLPLTDVHAFLNERMAQGSGAIVETPSSNYQAVALRLFLLVVPLVSFPIISGPCVSKFGRSSEEVWGVAR